MSTRFRDYSTHLYQFAQMVLVQCPLCNRCARSIYIQDRSIWQVTCIHCGYAKTNRGKTKNYGGAVDPVFNLPLWLQAPCCHGVLWAYNADHLDFLEQYVQATLRERQGSKGDHHSIAVRLPRWMKLAKHRESILKAMQDLKNRLD
jgi:Zn ribbon nucleic-acid-binding protein